MVSQVQPRIEAMSCDSNHWKMLPPVIWLCTVSHGSLQHVFLFPTFVCFFFFWGYCAFPAQSEIHSLNWNTAAAAHMVVFSSEEVKWWPTYKKLLALEETLFEHILQFVVLVWFCLLQAGKEGNCFISVNPNLAQLLCPNAWVSY